jgi:type IV secretory pathway TrbF-like protein
MLTEIVSAIRLLATNWTFEALLFLMLGPDVAGEIVWSGGASKVLGAVFIRAMLDGRSVRT